MCNMCKRKGTSYPSRAHVHPGILNGDFNNCSLRSSLKKNSEWNPEDYIVLNTRRFEIRFNGPS